MSHDRLTCVVPTHNRPHFLRRWLRFYTQFPPGFPFLIVDSSEPSAAAENLSAIESARRELVIEYRHHNLSFHDKCIRGLELVETPCVVICADDDLVFPDAARQCAEFLEREPGYASAMGRTAQLDTKLPRWCCTVLKGYSIEDDEPLQRCRRMASIWFTNFYAVYRTRTLLDSFRITAANTDFRHSVHMPEMLLTQLSVLRGRVKVLPLMYSLLERHATNTSGAQQVRVRPQAELHYERFRRCLADQCVQAGIGRAEAERFIDDSYGFFRNPNLENRRRPRSTVERIRRLLRQVIGMTGNFLGRDDQEGSTASRLVRARDVAGCEPIWHAAVKLIRDFPQGIPSDHAPLERCA